MVGGPKMEFIEIEIAKFESLIKRKDIKSPQWFAMEYDILEHPDFFDITGEEFKVYVWILGIATKLNRSIIRVYPSVCSRRINVSKKTILLTIEKLKEKRWHVTDTLRKRTESVRTRTATVQDSTVQDSTEQGNTIVELFNENRGDLPEVKKVSKKRKEKISARLADNPDTDYWRQVFITAGQSDFLTGKVADFKASFDWIMANEDNHLKVFEGNYENRKQLSKSQQISNNNAEMWKRIENGDV
jgi:hypothetical protein